MDVRLTDVTPNEFQERIGVGRRSNIGSLSNGEPRRRAVIAEEGPRRGEVSGFHTDHADGRVDATVFAPAVSLKTRVQEI